MDGAVSSPSTANPDAVVAITTVDQRAKAEEIARALVDARLAACVSILTDLTSVYRWKDAVAEESEVLLLIKTRRTRLDELKSWLATHHPYDAPEFLAFESVAVTDDYLSWLLQATQPARSGDP